MKHRILLMGAALAALTPSLAYARDCERQRSGRVAATVGGAAVGAVGGAVIAGRGDDAEGAIIGGVLGAIAGNQIAKPSNDCKRAYGWYDKDGRWHATAVASRDARGYYDRNGDWVEGRPGGYYDNGRWVATSADDGYYDRDGHYVPASTVSYYDRQGRLISGSQAGYWANGRWNAGASRGYYDQRGRWIEGQSPYGADEQPGYYDQRGRWIAGRTNGYYDSRGRWVSTRTSSSVDRGDRYGDRNDRYSDRGWNDNAPRGASDRIAWLRDQINGGSIGLSRSEASFARTEINAIDAQYRQLMRSGGRFTVAEEARIDTRLDRLTERMERASVTAYRN